MSLLDYSTYYDNTLKTFYIRKFYNYYETNLKNQVNYLIKNNQNFTSYQLICLIYGILDSLIYF